jgi:hypothetical protein
VVRVFGGIERDRICQATCDSPFDALSGDGVLERRDGAVVAIEAKASGSYRPKGDAVLTRKLGDHKLVTRGFRRLR